MSIGADAMLVIFYETVFWQHGYCCKLGSLIFLMKSTIGIKIIKHIQLWQINPGALNHTCKAVFTLAEFIVITLATATSDTHH
jgi:hypothetical protein